jgi:hypothetical protein
VHAGSTARSRHVGSIGANIADRLGHGRSRGSVPRGIESDARAPRVIRSCRRTCAVDSIGGQLTDLDDGLTLGDR